MNIDDVKSLTPGFQLDLQSPISMTEANALRDRQKSIINLLTDLKTIVSDLQTKVSSLSSRVDNANELSNQLSNQLNSVSMKVNDIAASYDARLKRVESAAAEALDTKK